MSMAPVPPVARAVVPVGGSDREFLAQETALRMASFLEAPILALHVQEVGEVLDDAMFAYLVATGRGWNVPIDVRIVRGLDAAEEILDELGPQDLVVIGTQRLGGKYHLHSVAEALVRQAPCSVQVVRLDD